MRYYKMKSKRLRKKRSSNPHKYYPANYFNADGSWKTIEQHFDEYWETTAPLLREELEKRDWLLKLTKS